MKSNVEKKNRNLTHLSFSRSPELLAHFMEIDANAVIYLKDF